jgi:hypothetical protein
MLRDLQSKSLAALLMLSVLASLAPIGDALGEGRARRSSVAPLGGVNIGLSYGESAAEVDQMIALARAVHSRVVRMELAWSGFEPLGPSRIDPRSLAFTDRVMADAAAAGITVIATVRSTPCWASSAPAAVMKLCSATRLSEANAWPPREPSSYGAFVAYLAQRYGPRLAAIEVWNEPDQVNELYLAGRNKAVHYAALLRAAYPAIKRADPSVRVLAGSLVGSNGVFLRALYAAGIRGYYDGLAVHYYSLTLASVRSIRQVQLANGDTAPLWLDEFGWSSCWPRHRIQEEQACVTAQVQATNIVNTVRSLARTPYIAAEVLFQLRDSGAEDFGVVSGQGARKPAFRALAGAFASPFGRVGSVSLSLRRRRGHALATGSGPVGDFMALEVRRGGVLRYTATFLLDRFNRYSISLPRALGTSGLVVRAYRFWAGSGEAIQRSI